MIIDADLWNPLADPGICKLCGYSKGHMNRIQDVDGSMLDPEDAYLKYGYNQLMLLMKTKRVVFRWFQHDLLGAHQEALAYYERALALTSRQVKWDQAVETGWVSNYEPWLWAKPAKVTHE